MAPLHGGSSAGKSDLCCGRSLNVVGRPGLHQSGLMSTCFADCPSPGPRKNDLTIYWALGPFVRSFTLQVDPGDICPPQESCETVTTEFVSRPPPCTRGNENHDIFGRKLDSGDDGERPRGARSGAPLTRGKGSHLSTE
jgi:hypothetical protein